MMKKSIKTIPSSKINGISNSLEETSGTISLVITGEETDLNENEKLIPNNIIESEIVSERSIVNGKEAIEGEILISKEQSTNVQIDINGDLIISDKHAENYSINEMGELIFTR